MGRIVKEQRQKIQEFEISTSAKRFLEDKLNIDFGEDATIEQKCQRKSKLTVKYGSKFAKELNFVSDCSESLDIDEDQLQVDRGNSGYKISINVENE